MDLLAKLPLNARKKFEWHLWNLNPLKLGLDAWCPLGLQDAAWREM